MPYFNTSIQYYIHFEAVVQIPVPTTVAVFLIVLVLRGRLQEAGTFPQIYFNNHRLGTLFHLLHLNIVHCAAG